MPTTLIIASANPHKVDEFRAILAPLAGQLTIAGLADLGAPFREPEETGATFEHNAAIKALSYAAQTSLPCLADDSGLEVDALSGRPGVISSHYFNDGRTDGPAANMPRAQRDLLNNHRLLTDLAGIPFPQRSARFVCVLALAVPPRDPQALRASSPAPPALPLYPQGLRASSAATTPTNPDDFHSYDGAFRRYARELPHMEVAGATYSITFNSVIGNLEPEERLMVLHACLHWHGTRMHAHVVTVMPDHVHMLIRPLQRPDSRWPTLRSILHSIKSFTSHRINERRNRTGQVWQTEYYDRIARSYDEIIKTREYIQLNPVRAGLCDAPGTYPFTALEGRVQATVDQAATEDVGPGCGRHARNPLSIGAPAIPTDPQGLRASSPATPPRLLATFRATFEGRIGFPAAQAPEPSLAVPRGQHGFGYDPLFLVAPNFTRASAELTPTEKNAASHRARAAAQLLHWLQDPANLAALTGPD